MLCGGPCLTPRVQAPVHAGYPFMHPDDIARTQPEHGPALPSSRRARRLAEDRAHHPEENR